MAATTVHRGQVEKMAIEKDGKLTILFDDTTSGATGGFTRFSFNLPDDRALRNFKDDIDNELTRRRQIANSVTQTSSPV